MSGKNLILSENCVGTKCLITENTGRPITGRHSDDIMSVADYGPSSQTLTFLDPEDDLGSLGIGADTQVDTFDVTCKRIFPSLFIKKLTI